MKTKNLTKAVADLLTQRAGQWVDGRELARVGGTYAWRSRVSDARRQLGLPIQNRQRIVRDGERQWKVSEYMTPAQGQMELF